MPTAEAVGNFTVFNIKRNQYRLSGNSTNPHSLLLFLMEQKEIKQEDLVDIIGSKKVVSDIINGERSISKDEAKTLADFFGVDAELFI